MIDENNTSFRQRQGYIFPECRPECKNHRGQVLDGILGCPNNITEIQSYKQSFQKRQKSREMKRKHDSPFVLIPYHERFRADVKFYAQKEN